MNYQQAESLAAKLNAEAVLEDTGWTFAAVQADNCPRNAPPQAIQWAVAGLDEDGTPTSIWVSPDLSVPTNF